jgi:ABC-2 type transport system ATP-binding protein
MPFTDEEGLVTKVVRALDAGGVVVDDISVHRPALDDVFMSLTGHRAELDEAAA